VSNRTIAIIAAVLGMTTAMSGAELVEIQHQGSECRVVNRLPAPIAVLTQNASSGSVTYATLVVPADGSAACALATQPEMLRLEVLDYFMSGTRQISKQEAIRLGQLTQPELEKSIGEMRAAPAKLSIEGSTEARRQLMVAGEIAQIQLQQRADEIKTRRVNPVGAELDSQTTRDLLKNGDWQGLSQFDQAKAREHSQQSLADATDTVMALSAAFDTVDRVKLSQLAADRDRLRALVKDSEILKADLGKALKAAEAEAVAGQSYCNAVVKSFDGMPKKELPSGEVRAGSSIKRMTTGPSGKTEIIEVELAAPSELAVLFAEVTFDKGQGHQTILRRIDDTNLWHGEIFWAIPASQAKIKVRHPGNGHMVSVPGSVTTGRPPLTASVDQATRVLASIKKEFKETSFRADGGDNIRTVAIP
jgi:hypothetical protein